VAEQISNTYDVIGTYEHSHYEPPGRLATVTRGRTVRCGRCGHILSEESIPRHEAMWCRAIREEQGKGLT
jgi:hypothetical protein